MRSSVTSGLKESVMLTFDSRFLMAGARERYQYRQTDDEEREVSTDTVANVSQPFRR